MKWFGHLRRILEYACKQIMAMEPNKIRRGLNTSHFLDAVNRGVDIEEV